MRTLNAVIAAGQTDPGRRREVNEDRFHCDAARGLFIVIDGVGGQAAGGKAADIALETLRTQLQRETGGVAERVRRAITTANNEIYRLAGTRAQWNGMACVLTVAVVDHGKATIGHVGDTRLYRLRNNSIEKVTKDHSPVGEREDSKELSEQQAMRHPRRNEVYRDVGSEPHEPDDEEFVDVLEIPFDGDSALLLCSDGLSDQIDSATIADVVNQCVGDPEAVARALIEMANAAGGKDNVTAVYVEGDRFAASRRRYADSPRQLSNSHRGPAPIAARTHVGRGVVAGIALLVLGFTFGRLSWWLPSNDSPGVLPVSPDSDVQVVKPGESIAAAIERAAPATKVLVEPGEYRERVFLKNGIRLVSRVPRAAILRLPADASDTDSGPAIAAAGVSNATISGFKIVGDAATPLGVGISITGGDLSVIDIEIAGATKAGIDFAEGSAATLLASDIHDNPGAALRIRAGANPRIANNVFSKNGLSERASGSLVIEAGSTPRFEKNVFVGLTSDVFAGLEEAARSAVNKLNWFVPLTAPGRPLPSPGGGRQNTR